MYLLRNLTRCPIRAPSARLEGFRRSKLKGTAGLEEDMRRLLGPVCVTAVLLLFSHSALACGDKLLILGRPLRFNSHPASILAYAPRGSTVESVLSSSQWATAITKGKHRLRVVETPEQLTQALQAARFDVILVSSPDARALSSELSATSFPAVFVPVFETGARDALRKADKEFGVAMKDMAKSGDYLSTIERAVALHDLRVEAAARVKKNHAKSS